MVQLFSIMILGYVLCKLQIMNQDFNQRLNKIVMNVTLPAMILSSVLTQEGGSGAIVVYLFKLAVALYLLLPVVAFVLVKLLRFPKEQQGLYMFMTVYSNVGFMGYPVINAIYGPQGVFYTAIFNIIFNLSAFTLGVWIINYGSGESVRFDYKKLLTPGVLFSILAVVVYFLQIRLPEPIVNVFNTVGSMTTPLAMILIGATLGAMNLKEIFNEWRMYPYAVIKQLGLPLLAWPLLSRLIADELILGITFILVSMPIANTSVIFATEYGRGQKLAAKNVFITTLMSIVTVPVVVYLCQLA